MTVAVKPHRNGKPTAEKTAGNSAGKASGRPFVKGHDPRRGVGKPGRSGRPPEEWKAFCRATLSQPEVRDAIERAVKDPDGRGYPNLLKLLAGYAEGTPVQHVTVAGDQNAPIKFSLALGDAHVSSD